MSRPLLGAAICRGRCVQVPRCKATQRLRPSRAARPSMTVGQVRCYGVASTCSVPVASPMRTWIVPPVAVDARKPGSRRSRRPRTRGRTRRRTDRCPRGPARRSATRAGSTSRSRTRGRRDRVAPHAREIADQRTRGHRRAPRQDVRA